MANRNTLITLLVVALVAVAGVWLFRDGSGQPTNTEDAAQTTDAESQGDATTPESTAPSNEDTTADAPSTDGATAAPMGGDTENWICTLLDDAGDTCLQWTVNRAVQE